MALDKQNTKLEARLVDLQNKVSEILAKLDGLMKSSMKDSDIKAIEIPAKEDIPTWEGHPYRELTVPNNPDSTIRPPLVLPEGQTVPQAIDEAMQERQDMSTIPAPKVETPGSADASTPAPSPTPAAKPITTPAKA